MHRRALLLLSLFVITGVEASSETTWYLNPGAPSGGPWGFQVVGGLQATPPVGSSSHGVGEIPEQWIEPTGVQLETNFGTAAWTLHIQCHVNAGTMNMGGEPPLIVPGTGSLYLEIGYVPGGGGSFSSAAAKSLSPGSCSGDGVAHEHTLTPGSDFVIPADHHLAVQTQCFCFDDGASATIYFDDTADSTRLIQPAAAAGQPVPAPTTILLLCLGCAGVLAFAGRR